MRPNHLSKVKIKESFHETAVPINLPQLAVNSLEGKVKSPQEKEIIDWLMIQNYYARIHLYKSKVCMEV